MTRVRWTLAAALVAAITAIIIIGQFSFEDWYLWTARTFMALFGLFAFSVAVLLVSTLFKASDNLWDTSYFKYMRAFWGNAWGGSTYFSRHKLQISVCRATWLSVITFALWLVMIGVFAFSVYFTSLFFANGVFYIELIKDGDFASQLGWIFILDVIILAIGIAFAWLNILRESIYYDFRFYRPFAVWPIALLASAEMGVILIVIPLQTIGASEFLSVLFWGLIGSLIIAFFIGIVVGIIWGIVKASSSLSSTVPAILTKEQIKGVKHRFCPLIIEE